MGSRIDKDILYDVYGCLASAWHGRSLFWIGTSDYVCVCSREPCRLMCLMTPTSRHYSFKLLGISAVENINTYRAIG